MVREKKSMIGFDPLAWLDDEQETKAEANNKAGSKKVGEGIDGVSKKIEKKSSIKKDKIKFISVLGHKIDETALLKGYALAVNVLDKAVNDFYFELFDQYPGVKPLFENTSEKTQAAKLVGAIKLLIDNLHNEDALRTTLAAMGERHQAYGALPDHYPVVANLLVASFKKSIGRSWTKVISSAWLELLVAAAETMCEAYKEDTSSEKEDVDTVNNEVLISDHNVEEINNSKSEEVMSVENDSLVPLLYLQTIQDISKSLELKNDMLSLLNDNDEISIDASSVERIDGSAMQLLCTFFNYAAQNNLIIHWVKPTDVLVQSAKTLGMLKILELN